MNLLLRNKIKTLLEDINNIEHEHNLMSSKIGMQESHIMSMRENKDKIIQQKQTVIKENESELLKEKQEKKNFKIETKNS